MHSFKEPLSSQEEREYLEKLMKGNSNARDALIERNMRLVAHIARKYISDEAEAEDLISVGTIGLIKAVNSFDPSKGIKLGTYAAKCIENELLMMFRSEKKRSRDISLNEPIGVDKDGNSISLIDVIEENQYDVIEDINIKEKIEKMISSINDVLNEKERDIIVKRYGLNGEKPITQRVISEQYGISRSYVSRIEKKALMKLKTAMSK